ncbi:MAG: ATP-binding protein [Nanoarchaeota archaeon]|nr:ATP-binding protein [Nanoarchaeota archaeon]
MLRKIILTGTTSSGKSSVIKQMEERGYLVLPEVAREVIKQRAENKITPEEILIRQYEMSLLQILQESNLEKKAIGSEVCFLDRSVVDNLAYCSLYFSYYPYGIQEVAKSRNYSRQVFLFDPLPFVPDGVRIEDPETVIKIHNELIVTYTRLGYSIISVPVIGSYDAQESIKKRADFILDHCEKIKRGDYGP